MASFNWTPWIEDPTFAGWLTVALYWTTSFSCWKAGREAELEDNRRSNERYALRSIAILFLALGINKLLNLMTALTMLGRAVAYLQGWYERRQSVQVVLIGLVAVLCVLAAIALLIWMRRVLIPTWFALIGTTMTLAFVLIRAISYHDIDRFLSERIFGLPWNRVIEIGGISVVLLASQMVLTRRALTRL
jgi:hypothetical protein